MSHPEYQLHETCVNTLRFLSADAVEQAKSGHPGLPLGAASMAYVLWSSFLRHNPRNPFWHDRDRFILSAGHGSALLYALLHLTGYDLPLDEIQRFRQWNSKAPGHPEYDLARGVECTTGPLGQGFAMGVGMALAERFLASVFNRPGFPIVNHYTYAIVSDGDLMEGVASEAASIAGNLRLGKLVYLYDDNHISIEGSTEITFTEKVDERFESYGWHVTKVDDGNDLTAIEAAIGAAQRVEDKPSLIMIHTHIGYGSPKQDSPSAHGEPLGADALRAAKERLGWPLEPMFFIPNQVRDYFRGAIERGIKRESEWLALLAEYRKAFPTEAERFDRQLAGELPPDWDQDIPTFSKTEKAVATRSASGKVLNAIANKVTNLIGGSADLAPSTKTLISGSENQAFLTPTGRNLRFGVREHGMGAIVNGMALHGGVIPYAATFFIFSDYMRPALRLAALMNLHVIYVFTHDSLAVGEDGPTHQPVEQLASLRCTPNFTTIRPADANETAQAWRLAMQRHKPVALVLTRQNVPILDPTVCGSLDNVARGAYILSESGGKPDLLLIASGSEVHLALEAQRRLAAEKEIQVRVISMPSWELFREQPQEYQNHVLPPAMTARLSIEAGTSFGWTQWVGEQGDCIAVDRFGASAPGGQVLENYGFNVDNVVERATAMVRRLQD